MEAERDTSLTFRGSDLPADTVLRFLGDRHMIPVRFEQLEPTLEDLFLEVVE